MTSPRLREEINPSNKPAPSRKSTASVQRGASQSKIGAEKSRNASGCRATATGRGKENETRRRCSLLNKTNGLQRADKEAINKVLRGAAGRSVARLACGKQ